MKLTNRRSKPAVPSTLKRGKSSSQNKNRTSKRMNKLVLRSVCTGNHSDVPSIPSFEQESVLADTSNAHTLPVISNASLFQPIPRRQSAVAAVLNLRKRLTVKRNSTTISETTDNGLVSYTEGIDASLRHAQRLLLSRIRFQHSRKKRDTITTLFEETQADSSRSSLLSNSSSNPPTTSGPLKCSMTDVIISNIRLSLMWTEKQHFVYAQRRRTTLSNVPNLKNRKFALLCVAISSGDVAVTSEETKCNTVLSSRAGVLCSQLNSQSMADFYQDGDQTDTHLLGISSVLVDDSRGQPASRQVVCSEIVRDVDWAATDVVFKSPLKLTFRRSGAQSSVRGVTRSQSNASVGGADTNTKRTRSRSSFGLNDTVSSTSNETQNGSHIEQGSNSNSKTESVRLEFYATLHDEDSIDEEAEYDEVGDTTLRSRRHLEHQSAESFHRRPNFRLIAVATLSVADLERNFESGQVMKAKATGRGHTNADFDYNTTVAHPLERLPIALEPNNVDANRHTAKRTRLSLSLKAAMRRLSEGVQSTSTSSTSILSASGINDTDELPFRIPLFGAFTFALRVNTFDLQASFV